MCGVACEKDVLQPVLSDPIFCSFPGLGEDREIMACVCGKHLNDWKESIDAVIQEVHLCVL